MTDFVVCDGQPPRDVGPSTIQREMWICDVCKVQKFEDFDEACRHEEACKIQQEGAKRANHTAAVDKSKDKDASGDEATNTKRKKRRNPTEIDQMTAKKKSKKIPSMFNVQKKPKHDTQKGNKTSKGTAITKGKKGRVLQDVKSDANSKPSNSKQMGPTAFVSSQDSSSSENSVQFVEEAKQSPKRATRNKKRDPPSCSNSGSVQLIQIVHPDDQQKRQQKKTKTTKANTDKSKNTDTLAAIFQKGKTAKAEDEEALVAEQVAAEFQAKRRLEREKERERQQKRQEAFFQRKPSSKPDSKPKEKSSKFSCPPFPVPAFLHPPANSNDHPCLPKNKKVIVGEKELEKARTTLQKSLPFPGRNPYPLEFTDEAESEPSWEFLTTGTESKNRQRQAHSLECRSIQTELANILTISQEPSCNNSPSSLWAEKHCLTDLQGICGETNQSVAKHLDDFVREWMVERQKAHQRMAERQKALLKKRKTTNKRKKKTKEEDLWVDSEDEDNALPSICLIEGPVGSCKSSLVHAVARQRECPVVELNTAAKRGSANLRKVLEEATLSHSSLDMLKKREANLFGQNDLVDSDDDENDGEQSGASLTVILIDEVDNIFEGDNGGDNGFWTALNDLTKKARCPVFLTANSFPKGLSSVSLRFRHFITSRPSPKECAKKIEELLRQQGLSLIAQHNEMSNSLQGLASVAELCGCDIRRIMHELQLFSCAKQCTKEVAIGNSNENSKTGFTLSEPEKQESINVKTVTIESVSPKIVSSEQCSLITIKGKNFKHLHRDSMRAFVGGHECHGARLVDDETILAVCPPCLRPCGVDRHGMRKATSGAMEYLPRPSSEARYAPLSLQSVRSDGNCSSSLRPISLLGQGSISMVSPCNIEYSFPASDERPPSDDEDVEFDDVEESPKNDWLSSKAYCLAKRGHLLSPSQTQREEAEKLIKAELEKVQEAKDLKLSTISDALSAEQSGNQESKKEEALILEQIARDLELASDASMLDSHVGVPFLSGASPGFGYRFTPEGSTPGTLSRHGNATQCSEERLFSVGWKDTCAFYGDQDFWMVQPSGRDLKLLTLVHTRGRGQAQSMEQESQPSASDVKDDYPSNNEHDLALWSPVDSRVSEEDCCLPQPIPSSLMCLPFILLNAGSSVIVAPQLKHDVVVGRRDERHDSLLEMMRVLYCDEAQAKMHCNDLYGSVGEFDFRLFLEYRPTLSAMAACEQAACSVPDAEDPATSRRRTRTQAKRGRSHYFESLNESYCWDDEHTYSAKQVGERFAHWLHYSS